MRETEILIPPALRWIHGERAALFDLLLVYATAVVFGVLALVLAWSRVADLPWWKSLLLFLIAADVSGGIVASLSVPTDAWYAERPALRWVFIFIHVVHPAALFLLYGGQPAWWAFLYVYTVAAASIVNVIRERPRQETAAAALLLLGILITLPLGLGMPFLAWFAPVYMINLVSAFAVRRS